MKRILTIALIAISLGVTAVEARQRQQVDKTVIQVGREQMVIRFNLIDRQRRPVVIFNHGDFHGPNGEEARRGVNEDGFGMGPKNVEWWKQRGYHVVAPLRRGFGESGDHYAGDFKGCQHPNMADATTGQVQDVMSTVEWVKRQPWSDGRVILIGQSGGGFAVIAAAATADPAIRGVVNFSGLRGANGTGIPCGNDQQLGIIMQAGKQTRVPELWVYAANDPKIKPEVIRQWEAGYKQAGGKLTVLLSPPIHMANGNVKNGHNIAGAQNVWGPVADQYLHQIGMVAR